MARLPRPGASILAAGRRGRARRRARRSPRPPPGASARAHLPARRSRGRSHAAARRASAPTAFRGEVLAQATPARLQRTADAVACGTCPCRGPGAFGVQPACPSPGRLAKRQNWTVGAAAVTIPPLRHRRAARGRLTGCARLPKVGGGMVRPEEFERLVAEALDSIPPELARYLENVAVVVEDEPSPALLRRLGLDPDRATLFGLYEGVPLPERPHDFAGALPDHITIFRGPLLRGARTRT